MPISKMKQRMEVTFSLRIKSFCMIPAVVIRQVDAEESSAEINPNAKKRLIQGENV